MSPNPEYTPAEINEAIDYCQWHMESDWDLECWNTSCKQAFYFDDDGRPLENGFNYCPYCGKPIAILSSLKPIITDGVIYSGGKDDRI